jgi:hypothetical protein
MHFFLLLIYKIIELNFTNFNIMFQQHILGIKPKILITSNRNRIKYNLLLFGFLLIFKLLF